MIPGYAPDETSWATDLLDFPDLDWLRWLDKLIWTLDLMILDLLDARFYLLLSRFCLIFLDFEMILLVFPVADCLDLPRIPAYFCFSDWFWDDFTRFWCFSVSLGQFWCVFPFAFSCDFKEFWCILGYFYIFLRSDCLDLPWFPYSLHSCL